MDHVIIMLDRPYIHHVVLAISLPGNLFSSKIFKPGLPLIRTVQCKRIGCEEPGGRLFSHPVQVKTMQGFKNTGFHCIKHLEGTHNGTSRKTLKDKFAFRDLSHPLAEILDFGESHSPCIPRCLDLPFDGSGRGMFEKRGDTNGRSSHTGWGWRRLQKPSTRNFLLIPPLLDFLSS